METPKRSWFAALDAIDEYRKSPGDGTLLVLRSMLKDADIYVPRDL